MNHHALGFIDNCYICIFIDNLKGNVFSHIFHLFNLRDFVGNNIPSLDGILGLFKLTIHQDLAFFDLFVGKASGQIRQISQGLVQTKAACFNC